jgi:flagellar assembly factor FliW
MPNFETKHFGNIEFEEASVVVFPAGLPGFEESRRFLALHFQPSAPLVYLQSLEASELCFVTLPVRAVEPDYRLRMSDEDLERIGLAGGRQPAIGTDVICLAVLSIRESGPTANLLAPVVVNLNNRLAVQSVAQETDYSHQHALLAEEEAACS